MNTENESASQAAYDAINPEPVCAAQPVEAAGAVPHNVYEYGPEGMPRVERMPSAVLDCIIDHSLFRYLGAALEGEGRDRLYGLMHDTANEVLARLPSWPVAAHQFRKLTSDLSLKELAAEFHAAAELGGDVTISAGVCQKLFDAMTTAPAEPVGGALVASDLKTGFDKLRNQLKLLHCSDRLADYQRKWIDKVLLETNDLAVYAVKAAPHGSKWYVVSPDGRSFHTDDREYVIRSELMTNEVELDMDSLAAPAGALVASDELLPCPFCGSTNIDHAEWSGNDGDSGPGCGDCGALADSAELWNCRSAPAGALVAAPRHAAGGLPVGWRDKLRRSQANTDYHGLIAFTPAQLEHFVSMLAAPVGALVAKAEPKPSFHVITDNKGRAEYVTNARHEAQEHINDACGEGVPGAGTWRAVPVFEMRPSDDHLWEQTLRDRDTYHDWADKLAEAISKYFDAYIGEHSNMNCPWAEALEAIESAAPTESAAAPAEPNLEQLLIEHRIGMTPEYEGGWNAYVYRDSEAFESAGFGATPSEAVKVALLATHLPIPTKGNDPEAKHGES